MVADQHVNLALQQIARENQSTSYGNTELDNLIAENAFLLDYYSQNTDSQVVSVNTGSSDDWNVQIQPVNNTVNVGNLIGQTVEHLYNNMFSAGLNEIFPTTVESSTAQIPLQVDLATSSAIPEQNIESHVSTENVPVMGGQNVVSNISIENPPISGEEHIETNPMLLEVLNFDTDFSSFDAELESFFFGLSPPPGDKKD